MNRNRSILVIAALAVLWGWFFAPVLWGGRVLFFRDTTHFSYPIRWYCSTYFTWRPPLWNPDMFLGYPIFANPALAIFYPLNLLLQWGEPLRMYQFFIAVHVLLALAFTYILVWDFTKDRTAAVLAAVGFAFSNVLIFSTSCHTHIATPVWLPAVLLGFCRYEKTRAYRWFAFSAVALGLQILSGEVYYVIFSVLLLAAFATTQQRPLHHLKILALIAATGGMLAAVQVLPTVEFIRLSSRIHSFSLAEASAWSLHPWRLIEFFLPLFWGGLTQSTDSYWGTAFFGLPLKQPFFLGIYIGLLPVLLFLAYPRQLFKKTPARFWFWAGTAALLLALGPLLPLFRLVHLVLANFRYPEKFMWMTAFCWTVAAAFVWVEAKHNLRRLLIAAILTMSACGAVLLAQPLIFFKFSGRLSAVGQQAAYFSSSLALWHTLTVAGLFALFLIWANQKDKQKVALLWIVGVAALDLACASRAVLYTAASDYFQAPAWLQKVGVDRLREGRFLRSPDLLGRTAVRGYEETLLELESRVSVTSLRPNTDLFYGLHDAWGYDSVFLDSIQRLARGGLLEENFLKQAGVRWLLTAGGERVPPFFTEFKQWPELGMVLWQNEKATPRAYLPSGTVAWRRDEPELLELRVNAPSAGVLRLNDAYYPGWRVFIDGVEKPMELADGYARGVAVPPGEHAVVWRFSPRSFWVGLALSLATSIYLCFLGLPRERKRKSHGPQTSQT